MSNKVDKIINSILNNKFTDNSSDNSSVVSNAKSCAQSVLSNAASAITNTPSADFMPIYNLDTTAFPLNQSTWNNPNTSKHIVSKKVLIDVAVLCQEYTNVETMCDDNIINLDEIPISKECFQQIFYPYCDNFGINKEFVCCNHDLLQFISFLPEYRTVQHNKFYLLEALITNIEKNLNLSRNCFTKESIVELTNEIISIKSLCDINCCSVLATLTWCNIIEIINNYKLIQMCNCKCHTDKTCDKKCKCDNMCNFCDVIPILVINIIFKTPTCGVKNTIIRFNYRITNM
jgi:hypothetical protein